MSIAAVIALASILGGDDDGGPGKSIFDQDGGPNGQSNNDTQSDDGNPIPTAPPATPLPTPVTVEFVPAPGGFTLPASGGVQSACTPAGDAFAVLSWTPGDGSNREQEINLLAGGSNFVPGNYLTSGALDADASSFTQQGLDSGAVYFWRVNTRIEEGWVAGEPSRFETTRCLPSDQAQ